MKVFKKTKFNNLVKNNGFSLAELIIVLLIISIIVVLALPQIISSRRLFRFSGVQRQIVTVLRETRQEAMSQRKAITFRYEDNKKQIVIYGGKFGANGDAQNRVGQLADSGLISNDIKYGRPAGASVAALGDGTNLTNLTNGVVEVTFQADGSVVDTSDNPQNKTVFLYHSKYPNESAFAVSILGAGGRIKLWRFSQGVNAYVE
ncbi:MAG: prepilin-type N-terminal cleavage/methylation domain-containing protein [Aridibacter sp.]|jgi:prepilin-type N-terminal cleavage/methylation domain-containing protein